jgi:hypothetical protein
LRVAAGDPGRELELLVDAEGAEVVDEATAGGGVPDRVAVGWVDAPVSQVVQGDIAPVVVGEVAAAFTAASWSWVCWLLLMSAWVGCASGVERLGIAFSRAARAVARGCSAAVSGLPASAGSRAVMMPRAAVMTRFVVPRMAAATATGSAFWPLAAQSAM